jgi:alkylated DNA repair dioxygenase AlkB
MISKPAGTAPVDSFQPGLFDEDEPSLDLSFATARRVQLDETAWVEHVPGWLAGSGQVLGMALDTIVWEQRQRWMYTRMVAEPRMTAEYPVLADVPQPILREIGAVLSDRYGVRYERLWMNLYRDNNDGTGWHADRPANKLPETVIPVLSLGATRRFLIRPAAGGKSTIFTPASGDLIVMGGTCQRGWVHCVPKQKTAAGPRASLNFSARDSG